MKISEGKSVFLETLVSILDENTHCDIISWSDDGQCFTIHNTQKFSEEILPLFFKHNNFASFHRQLNLYGFCRDKRVVSGKAFKHPFFVRNRSDLISKIQKKRKEADLPLMLKKVPPASKYLIVCNAVKELGNKSMKLSERIEEINAKIDEVNNRHKLISEGNSASTRDVNRAKDMVMYFANWVKVNHRFIGNKMNQGPIRKNSEVEELTEDLYNDKVTLCDDMAEF